MAPVLAWIADLAPRRPWAFLAGGTAVLAAAVVLSLDAPDELGIGSTRLSEPPARPTPRAAELVVVLGGSAGAADSRVLRVAEGVVRAQVLADPAVEGARLVERRRGVVLIVRFGDLPSAERQAAAIRLADRIDPGPLRVEIGGEVARLLDARRSLTEDLWRPALLVLPLALLIVVAAAGLRRALAPVLCAAIAVSGSLALLRLAGVLADVSLLGFATSAAVGLVLGLEIPLLLLRRHDDEASVASPGTAIRRTVVDGGRAALGIALAAALAPLALLATPLDQAGSLALGCALAAGLAALAAVALVPATLAATGRVRHRGAGRGPALVARIAESRLAAGAGLTIAALALAACARPTLDAGSSPFASPLAGVANSIFPELPTAAAIAVGIVAVIALAAAGRPAALVAAPLPALVAAAGLGVCAFVFEDGNLVSLLDFDRRPSLDTGAVAIAACALVSISTARLAAALLAARDERRLGLGSADVAEQAAALTLAPALAATLVGVLAAGAMLATDLYPARELGLALAAGLVADLVLVRVALLAFAGRWIG